MARGKQSSKSESQQDQGPTKDTNEDTTPITSEEQQDNLDQRPDDSDDTKTSAEQQVVREQEQGTAPETPDHSGAPKSEDAPDEGPTPEVPAVTSAVEGPKDGVNVSATNDTSGTAGDLDSTYGVPGSDGEAPNPNVTSDQVDGFTQMPGHTPEDEKARDDYLRWFSDTGPRCDQSYCNKPEGHADGNVDPVHGWVNVG